MDDWERLRFTRGCVKDMAKLGHSGERVERAVADLLGLMKPGALKPPGTVKPM